MDTLTLVALSLGAAIVLINMYSSAICTITHRLREGHWPPVVPVGIPVAGTVLLLGVILVAPGGSMMAVTAALLALLDTGGPLFMLALVRYRRRHRLQRRPALR